MIIFPEDKNSNFCSQKSIGSCLGAFVPFLFKQPIRLKNDSAHDLSDSMGFSFSDCKERFFYSTIPLAPAIKMCLINNRSYVAQLFLYSQRDQCRIIPRGGLPRDASCKEVQLPSSEFCIYPNRNKESNFFYKSSKEPNNKRAVFLCENYEKGSF